MDHTPPLPPLDPAVQRNKELQLLAADILRGMLPPPANDTPEARAIRDRLALAYLGSLLPVGIAEIRVAANHIAAMEHASECMRQVGLHANDPVRVKQLHAQSASMGREARGYGAALQRMQAARNKRDSTPAGRETSAWTESCVLREMTEAMEGLPPEPRPAPPPVAAAPAAAAAAARPARVPLLDYDDWPEDAKQRDRLRAAADRYAILNTMRVKRIRQHGGLPPDCDFEPPEPEILQQIITGKTVALEWADTYEPWVPPSG